MRPTRRRNGFGIGVGLGVSWIVVAALGVTPAIAAVADGMVTAHDVGLGVVSKPHRSTVVAIDSVGSDCASTDGIERDARVESLAENVKSPTTGAQLNQVVFDFGSTSEAKAFFADALANDTQRANCGSTTKASDFDLTKGPGGVGDARYRVASTERVGGVARSVVSIEILTGASVTELIFLDWDKSLPTTTVVATKAVKRLG